MKIVVVEDEISFRRMLQLELDHAGFSTDATGMGREGIELFTRLKPELMIIDITKCAVKPHALALGI